MEKLITTKMELSFRGNRGLNNKNNYLNAFTSLLH